MSKISIIIPVYNAEKHIVKCLNSVLSQTYTDFEVLLINDGSTDQSLSICEAYCKKDERFKVVTQTNSGPSVARNRGIDESIGDYITFIDSDDYIEPNALEVLCEKAESSKADITIFGYYLEQGDVSTKYSLKYEPGVYHGKECRKLSEEAIDIHSKSVIPPYSWVRFVRGDFLRNLDLRFEPKIIRSEDYFFWIQVHFRAKTICMVTDYALYHYVDNVDSITHRYVKRYWEMSKIIYKKLKEVLPQEQEINERLDNMLVHRSLIALNNASFSEDDNVFKKDVEEILKDKELRSIIKNWKIKKGISNHKFYYLLMKLHLYSVVKIRYMIKR